jgi:hypothetical protein
LANIISDNFETGGFSASWSWVTTDGGNLSVAAAAKLHGNYGMSALINDTNELDVYYGIGSPKSEIRVRFYFDPNSISLPNTKTVRIFHALDSSWGIILSLKLLYSSSNYWIVIADSSWTGYADCSITDAPHCIEFHYKAASNNDGILALWIDGTQISSVTNIPVTAVVAYLTLGAINIEDASTSGTLFLDDFIANDDGAEIGQISTGVKIPVLLNQYRQRRS